MKHLKHIAGQRIHRLEALSDGVFAIVATLLVLDIKVPVIETIHSEIQLVHAFFQLTPKLLTYFMSFITLGIFWTGHTTQFHFIEKGDRHFIWTNLFFLLFFSIIPFTTAFLSEYITFKFAIAIYWLNILLIGVMFYINWSYVDRHSLLTDADEEKKKIGRIFKRKILTAQSLYAFGALLCLISTYLSIAVIIAVQLNYALALFSKPNKHKVKRQKSEKESSRSP
jgi:uncharacterized membrane protein